ncbi:MAG: cysteine desulfurase [Candidatus Taylorbacteria bacterium]|nr:cysteine desulfurase [Candidatus Taylorbacteria bacterium]
MFHFFNSRVYLDHASLTPTDPRVLSHMKKWYRNEIGNPSSLHREGVAAHAALDTAKKKVAELLRAHADEIIFTGTGTEANNIGIMGVVQACLNAGISISDIHIITSSIEHTSVLECFYELERRGAKLDVIGVTHEGVLDIEEFKKKLSPTTTLVSVQYVNNEIGTVQPLEEIIRTIRHVRKESGKAFPYFHTDASQAFLCNEVNLEKLGADLLTLDAHKVYGPKGIGMLYIRRGVVCAPTIYGGGQEKGLRSGTENVPSIMGFVYALEIAQKERVVEIARLTDLRKFASDQCVQILPTAHAHGAAALVSPHILNIEFPGYDAESLMLRLDAHGIACSTKSSCLRDSDESYVMKAIGAATMSSIRLSFGRITTRGDIKKFAKVLKKVLPLAKLE